MFHEMSRISSFKNDGFQLFLQENSNFIISNEMTSSTIMNKKRQTKEVVAQSTFVPNHAFLLIFLIIFLCFDSYFRYTFST
jgi:amino acid permease